MIKAYLTIDDTPSAETDALTDYLAGRNIPALLFCRGDRLEENPGPVIRAIQKGFVIGNHGFAHKRASSLTHEECCEDIKKADELIEQAYKDAGVQRPGKYFRFAYMDRGMGPWLVEEDLPGPYEQAHRDLLHLGLGHEPQKPDLAGIERKRALQEVLNTMGYRPVPFRDVTIPWYAKTEMAQAIDALCTFSTSDWMLTPRHLARDWPYKTIDDLKARIGLAQAGSRHIILAHDQEGLFMTVRALVEHCIARQFEFLDF
jgi:peptidoglycan-N-acetylglucosamine deacetylase